MPVIAAHIRRWALALPEAAEAPHFELTSFRVRGRIFATMPPGGGELRVFVADEDRDPALAAHPGIVHKLHWGGKVVGLTIDLGSAPAAAVKALLRKAWAAKAPKTAAAQAPAATAKAATGRAAARLKAPVRR
jgi:hypothetical protein